MKFASKYEILKTKIVLFENVYQMTVILIGINELINAVFPEVRHRHEQHDASLT